jgi:hypothetical protein
MSAYASEDEGVELGSCCYRWWVSRLVSSALVMKRCWTILGQGCRSPICILRKLAAYRINASPQFCSFQCTCAVEPLSLPINPSTFEARDERQGLIEVLVT